MVPGRLAAAAAAAWVAGGFWALGHAAGPVGAVYLWTGGGRRERRAVLVPLAASVLAVAVFLGIGGRGIDESARINNNLHGRTLRESFDPLRGALATLRVIPANLILGNLGIDAELTTAQAVTLTLTAAAAWIWWRLLPGRSTPLENAGGTLVLLSYLLEWSVRGYLPFEFVRRTYAWYDILPHLGAVLFLVGWIGGTPTPNRPLVSPSWSEAGAIAFLMGALLLLHGPRIESTFISRQPPSATLESPGFSTLAARRTRALRQAANSADRQRRQLERFDRAEAVARSHGIGRDIINQTFEPVLSPSTPAVRDGDLFDLPHVGSQIDPINVREAMGALMQPVP